MSRTRTWPITALALLIACLSDVALLARPASAQQPGVAPDELTQAILRYAFRYDGVNVRLLDGRVPDDLGPNFYAPPGTRVLGSVIMGSGVLVLAKSSAPPESLRAVYTRALERAGWKPFEMMRRGGFVESAVELPLILCRDGAQLHVQQLRRVTGGNDLFLHYRDAAGPCEPPQPPVFRAMSEPPPYPTLYAPPGTGRESTMRCYPPASGRRGSTGTSTMLAADISAEEVLRHYARQLESGGWRPAPASGRIATATWTRADSTGTTELKLQVRETATSGPRCYDVQMTLADAPR
jgi:hypothetical protein